MPWLITGLRMGLTHRGSVAQGSALMELSHGDLALTAQRATEPSFHVKHRVHVETAFAAGRDSWLCIPATGGYP